MKSATNGGFIWILSISLPARPAHLSSTTSSAIANFPRVDAGSFPFYVSNEFTRIAILVIPSPAMSIKYLTQTELTRFFSVIRSPRDRALFGVIYHYGLRVTEATILEPSNVDFGRRTIYIPRLKGGVDGVKVLLDNTAVILQAYLAVRAPTADGLFTGRQGTLKRHRIAELFKSYARLVGLGGYSVHCLRHSIGTHMMDAGFDLADVQKHLGHKKLESAEIYGKITDKRAKWVLRQMGQSSAIVKVT